MSRCQNVTPSDELAKRKIKIAEMEQELAAERERVRKEEEEEACAHEAAEVQQRAATALQQRARENRPRVELPRRSALPVVLRSGASGSLSRCVLSFHSTTSHGVSANNCCSVRHVNAASNWRSRASPAVESGARLRASAALAARRGVRMWAHQRVWPPLRMWRSGRRRCTRVRRWSRMRWTVRRRC